MGDAFRGPFGFRRRCGTTRGSAHVSLVGLPVVIDVGTARRSIIYSQSWYFGGCCDGVGVGCVIDVREGGCRFAVSHRRGIHDTVVRFGGFCCQRTGFFAGRPAPATASPGTFISCPILLAPNPADIAKLFCKLLILRTFAVVAHCVCGFRGCHGHGQREARATFQFKRFVESNVPGDRTFVMLGEDFGFDGGCRAAPTHALFFVFGHGRWRGAAGDSLQRTGFARFSPRSFG